MAAKPSGRCGHSAIHSRGLSVYGRQQCFDVSIEAVSRGGPVDSSPRQGHRYYICGETLIRDQVDLHPFAQVALNDIVVT